MKTTFQLPGEKKDLSKERNTMFVWSNSFNQETDAAYYFLEMTLGS